MDSVEAHILFVELLSEATYFYSFSVELASTVIGFIYARNAMAHVAPSIIQPSLTLVHVISCYYGSYDPQICHVI